MNNNDKDDIMYDGHTDEPTAEDVMRFAVAASGFSAAATLASSLDYAEESVKAEAISDAIDICTRSVVVTTGPRELCYVLAAGLSMSREDRGIDDSAIAGAKTSIVPDPTDDEYEALDEREQNIVTWGRRHVSATITSDSDTVAELCAELCDAVTDCDSTCDPLECDHADVRLIAPYIMAWLAAVRQIVVVVMPHGSMN